MKRNNIPVGREQRTASGLLKSDRGKGVSSQWAGCQHVGSGTHGRDFPHVFYKYKESVYPYSERSSDSIITVQVVLYDKPGVLMAVISRFYSAGANILTINQNIPVNGKALVSISARIDQMNETLDDLMRELRQVDGVQTIENIAGEP